MASKLSSLTRVCRNLVQNPSQLQDVFTSFLSVHNICEDISGWPTSMGSSVSMFDQPTNQPTNPLTPHPPFQLNFQASVGPFSLHLAACSAKSPFLTSGGRAGIGQIHPPFRLEDLIFQRLNHQARRNLRNLSRELLSQAFLQRICWFPILE